MKNLLNQIQSKFFSRSGMRTMRIRTSFLLLTATVLLSVGCLHLKSSPQAKSPSNNMPVEIIPQVSTAPEIKIIQPASSIVLLKNQYPNQPPRIGQVLQYCQKVCTWNWSGSMFGGSRSPYNICMIRSNDPDGTAHIFAHDTEFNMGGTEMNKQLAPDGVSACVWEAPQCNRTNGCLSEYDKCILDLHGNIPAGTNPCYYKGEK